MHQTVKKPLSEAPKLPQTEQEMLRISKSLLKKVDPPSSLTKTTAQPLTQIKEDAAVEMIRRMKREKAMKIIKQYRVYRLRVCVKKRAAARKIVRFYMQRRKA
jgi:hypothetical protein